MDDLRHRSVGELAQLVRAGNASPRELVTAALERIERLDKQVNAFTDVDAERALADADAVRAGDEAPFAGVPIAVKANVPVAGRAMSMASALLAGYRADYDAFVVRRLREAGFVIVGITN